MFRQACDTLVHAMALNADGLQRVWAGVFEASASTEAGPPRKRAHGSRVTFMQNYTS